MMKGTHRLCKGCAFNHDGCLLKRDKEIIHICPCINCIIKPMCTSQCKERVDVYTENCAPKYKTWKDKLNEPKRVV